MKVYVVGGDYNYSSFLQDVTLVNSVEEAEVVIFTGGADVSPKLYGCRKSAYTFSFEERDNAEKALFNKIKPNQLCLGICRGSQFLCVMNGGLLVQHTTGHAIGTTHGISNGEITYQITSTHHQMMYPYNLSNNSYDVLFVANHNLSTEYIGDKIHSSKIMAKGEPEIVLYHKKGLPKCLAVQGHPEMIPESPVAKMINDLVNNLITK